MEKNKGMNDYQLTDRMDLSVLEQMQTGEPFSTYIKTTKGKVGVLIFNPMTSRPEERILEGNVESASADLDLMLVKIWTESSDRFFKNANKILFEQGKIVPYNSAKRENILMVNAISDEEIDNILAQPFFTLSNKLSEFTAAPPVERILRKAKELNRPIKTINRIIERLNELQEDEMDTGALERHYKNIEA